MSDDGDYAVSWDTVEDSEAEFRELLCWPSVVFEWVI